jgi:hypothetical protein
MGTSFTLSFSTEIDQFYRKELRIDQTGRCVFWLGSNRGGPGDRPVGRFITQIPATEAAQMRERCLAVANEHITDPGPLPSGVAMYDAVLDDNGVRTSLRFDPYLIPTRFQVIGRRLLEIEAEALKTCLSGVAGTVQVQPEKALRTDPVTITVRLAHAGSEAARVKNPVLSGDAATGRMLLSGVRSDVPQEQLETIHRKAIELDDRLLVDRGAPRMADELGLDKTRLAAVEFAFRTPLDWAPGRYSVRLFVEMGGSAKDPDVLRPARIVSDPVEIQISGDRKPEDVPTFYYRPPKL